MKQNSSQTKQRGFTLVEIAIVLMIIGLLIGGILRGQELITSARVRNIIDQKAAIQTAQIGFLDRYRMLAGDLTAAQATIVGNGAISSGVNGGNGLIAITNDAATNESVMVFQNLAAAGFISCGPCIAVVGPAVSSINNSPVNVFGDFLMTGRAGNATGNGGFWWDWAAAGTQVRNLVTTGGSIGSQILAETDRKADDGNPGTGSLRHTVQGNSGNTTVCAPVLANATTALQTAPAIWANPAHDNCAGAWLL